MPKNTKQLRCSGEAFPCIVKLCLVVERVVILLATRIHQKLIKESEKSERLEVDGGVILISPTVTPNNKGDDKKEEQN